MGNKITARPPLTRLELQIMRALWQSGPGTVQAVLESLPAPRLAYTTVQTMLNILERKGQVKRRRIGRAYEYRPVVSRDRALGDALRDIVDRVFGGSVEDLVMNLVKSRRLDARKLARIQQLIDRYEQSGKEDPHAGD